MTKVSVARRSVRFRLRISLSVHGYPPLDASTGEETKSGLRRGASGVLPR
jgi:hypothetical protein